MNPASRTLRASARRRAKAARARSRARLKRRHSPRLRDQVAGYWLLGRELGGLAPSRGAAAWLALSAAVRPLRDRLPLLRSGPSTVRLRAGGHTFRYAFGDRSELDVLAGTFLEREYDVALDGEVRTIVDLGSNAGATVHWFRARYPDAVIHAVEPDPATFARLVRNTAGLPRVHLHEVAVAGDDGSRPFRSAVLSWGSGFAELTGGDRDAGLTVATRSLDTLLSGLGVSAVDLLKVDIEGAEFEVLDAFSGYAAVRAIVGEYHEGLHGRPFSALRPRLAGYELELRPGPERVRHFTAVRR